MTPFQRLRDGKSYIFGENFDQKRNLAATGFEVDRLRVNSYKSLPAEVFHEHHMSQGVAMR
jgi:uncharacterized protein YukJ